MLVLVMGAKGGVGTTSVAEHLARAGKGIGLDLADGQLAARLERPTWTLADAALRSAQQQRIVDQAVKRKVSLLWTPVCAALPNVNGAVWSFVNAVADRVTVVADGGIEPLDEISHLADVAVIVSAESDVAQFHTNRLKRRFPQAQVLTLDLNQSRAETRDAARELAAELFE